MNTQSWAILIYTILICTVSFYVGLLLGRNSRRKP